LAPNGKIPLGLTEGFDGFNWTSYMAQVFKYLKESGSTRGDYERRLREMPFVAGMKELLVQLTAAKLGKTSKRKYEMIIISDANSFFIQTFLEFHGLSESFTQLFTNPGSFDESGCLIIQEYHHQDWCDISAINMCKGYILEKYIERRAAEGVLFSRVAYCRDGQND
jgi:2,3-diketo-5-methylthio-1-phosphopentane phosphatase